MRASPDSFAGQPRRRLAEGLVIAAALALQPGMADAATPTASIRVQLSTQDKARIGAAACSGIGSDGAERIEARRNAQTPRSMEADVYCRPHGETESLPLVHVTRCSNGAGTWKCEPGSDASLLSVSKSSTVAVVADGVTLHMAIYLVREAAQLTVPPFHRPASSYMSDKCIVTRATTQAFKGATHFAIDCAHGNLALTRDCWPQGCRVFITGGDQT